MFKFLRKLFSSSSDTDNPSTQSPASEKQSTVTQPAASTSNQIGRRYIIIGNGPAGVAAAETLSNKMSANCSITMFGDEPVPPYSRMAIPYLLMGNIEESGTYLRKQTTHFTDKKITLVNEAICKIDTTAQSVTDTKGQNYDYDALLIASGASPIIPPVPGIDHPQVFTCWTMADARKIMANVSDGQRVLQIGAGFIGCIIMEAIVARGAKLTVVEMGNRMVPRMMTETAGQMIRSWVDAKGVDVVCDTAVKSLEAKEDNIIAQLGNGTALEVDVVICSAGVRPNVDYLADTPIKINQGVVVDKKMATSVPNVYATGDVVEAPDFFQEDVLSVNSIQPSAVDEARTAALNMLGQSSEMKGTLAINVLDTLGLISTSFGQWAGVPGGETIEQYDTNTYRYISLQFSGDILIGATAIGLTDHVGVLRGLIEGKVKLGSWLEVLRDNPFDIMKAYLAQAQSQDAL